MLEVTLGALALEIIIFIVTFDFHNSDVTFKLLVLVNICKTHGVTGVLNFTPSIDFSLICPDFLILKRTHVIGCTNCSYSNNVIMD